MKSLYKRFAQLLVIATLMFSGLAMAQAEPSMSQIYSTAQAGKLDEAQVMVQQVLISHPKSAKAYFVQAELYSRQGKLSHARESLATAEKYAPGLPFAKPEAVQTLRAQLSVRPVSTPMPDSAGSYTASSAPASSSTSWLLPLLLTGGVMMAGYFFFRRRNSEPYAQQPAYTNQNGLSGPQTFGTGSGVMQPAYPQPGYLSQTGPGLGGRIMGGVATGLAVGAGVMAAEAIGRNLMGDHHNASPQSDNNFEHVSTNTDMGGTNFGISDASWADGDGADAGSGGDWDN